MNTFASKTRLTPEKYLTDKEYAELERIIEKFYDQNFRNCLIIELLMKTGARAQEVLNIRKNDLNDELETVYIHSLKGGIDRDLPLPRKVYKRLKQYASTVAGDQIFSVGYDSLFLIWRDYRPVEKKLHALRHTAAIRFYKKSRSLHMVMKMMGHTNPKTTMIYLDFVEDREKIRKII